MPLNSSDHTYLRGVSYQRSSARKVIVGFEKKDGAIFVNAGERWHTIASSSKTLRPRSCADAHLSARARVASTSNPSRSLGDASGISLAWSELPAREHLA